MAVTEYFVRYLRARDALSDDELARLVSLNTIHAEFESGDVIVPDGPAPSRSCMILTGVAARRHDRRGRAGAVELPISALYVPGDFADLHSLTLEQQVGDIVALSACEVEYVEHSDLLEITRDFPHLTRLLWMSTVIDGQIHRQWLVNSATLRVSASIAHMLCELYTRLKAVGAAEDYKIVETVTQRDVAGALGYTAIHINRGVRDLRDAELVEWGRDQIRILDWTGLARLAQFNPAYLDVRKARR